MSSGFGRKTLHFRKHTYVNPPKKNQTAPPLGTQSYGGRASPCKSTGGGCMGFFGESRRSSFSGWGTGMSQEVSKCLVNRL